MQMRIRRPSWAEVACQIVFGSLACLLTLDLIDAASVRCDLTPELQWCSVWGGTEGPLGWSYQGQGAYLRHDIASLVILIVATLTPFVTPKPVWGVALSIGTYVLGLIALEYFGPMLL
jgi:hypothetical protein